jgi:16S rRNA (adenine1518-N6/adenine1519-N6)-dimethyltransferase
MTRQPLGQNFMISERWARRMVEALELPADSAVLEIGPGMGFLTRRLLEAGFKVTAIEKDAVMAPHLERPGLTVYFEDAAVFPPDIPEFLHRHGIRGAIGNLPYYIASRILLRFLPFIDTIGPMVFTFQREVAEKILSVPGDRGYGALAVLCDTWARPDKLGVIPPGGFRPSPKVDSAAVRFMPRRESHPQDFESFAAFLHQCTASPRKTLWNNLRCHYTPDILQLVLDRLNVPAAARPHQVDAAGYRALYDALEGLS